MSYTLLLFRQIEKANIMELDWAMANMESKPSKGKGKSSKSQINELAKVDTKGDVRSSPTHSKAIPQH